jgi:hypothetical protein
MSNTSTHPYSTGWPWLRRWFSGRPHMTIGGETDGEPYMLRWYVLPRNEQMNVYLHKFLRSDDDRALHDHPWTFWSLILKNFYDEVTPDGVKRRRPGSIARRPATARHRVRLMPTASQQARYDHLDYLLQMGVKTQLPTALLPGRLRPEEKPVWTLVVTGKKVREWGFWCPRWIREPGPGKQELIKADDEQFVHWKKFTNGVNGGCGEP